MHNIVYQLCTGKYVKHCYVYYFVNIYYSLKYYTYFSNEQPEVEGCSQSFPLLLHVASLQSSLSLITSELFALLQVFPWDKGP
jgi:hypothetical protein